MTKQNIIRDLKHYVSLCEISKDSDKDSLMKLHDELEGIQVRILLFNTNDFKEVT